ncbi:glycoside hydrolase family 88 protein [Amycolatopsis australiensis]|uniref:Rhamnogalacturonyl hydrolase YesR n=1 Tax=Amycolatopsis australiensis TaxID=546364 RepID=A0A1K1T6I4_9PSEU|nr:glycoside hydrolase family 88 protein [Amycolatopsis australiensis]SFW91983.1 Rhamnogalacturonyl hydrolase YesR [Amycolatopsis australiensis]
MRFRGIRGFGVLAAAALAGSLFTAPVATAATCGVSGEMVAAGNYWVTNGTNLAAPDWQNATFHVGNLALVRTTGQSNHKTYPWAQANHYELPSDPKRPFFPDNQAAGEAYLDLYTYFHPEIPLDSIRTRIRDEVASVQAGHHDYWNYVDALNMAMPSFARMSLIDKDPSYLDAMQQLFSYSEHKLFNEFTGLWYRDARFTGSGVFWSRGNGWALAALTKVLQVLPADDPRRPEYLRVFKKMAFTLALAQRRDGFWNSDLLNPHDHGGPESSGTALFTFGLGWGISAGILPAERYRPVVDKAWTALSTKALRAGGLVGYVQPVGDRPATARPDDTAAYGVGAFLLAGQQVAKLQGCPAD